jgi:hypothetical protein
MFKPQIKKKKQISLALEKENKKQSKAKQKYISNIIQKYEEKKTNKQALTITKY